MSFVFAMLAVLLTTLGPSPIPDTRFVDVHFQVRAGDGTPADHGRVWLYRFGEYGSHRVQVGTVSRGELRVYFDVHAMPELERDNPKYDDNFKFAVEFPGPVWYFGNTLASGTVFSGATYEIEHLASGDEEYPNGLVVLRDFDEPRPHTITLLWPDGRPAKAVHVDVGVHLGFVGHCALEAGPDIGSYTTDKEGTISVNDTGNNLYLATPNRDPASPGLLWNEVVVIPTESSVTRIWSTPKPATVSITLRYPDGSPARGIYIAAYLAFQCGDIESSTTDVNGVAKIHVMSGITNWIAYWPEGPSINRKISLGDEVVSQLINRGRLTVTIPRP